MPIVETNLSSQLDILALEPFYGGARKAMLDAILKHSRHRWTLLRLPPRRIERRLAAAAHWFAEQLSRHWVGRVDLLFTSEAMNLQDLIRQVPKLRNKPSVVYFHDNQLPPAGQRAEQPVHLTNLSTARCATEIWFNSLYHLKTFLQRATSLVDQHPELSSRNPLPDLAAKTQVMAPPVDLGQCYDILNDESITRDSRTIFVDTRDANIRLLNEALLGVMRRGENFRLITVGPVEGLSDELPRRTVSERDELAQIRALHEAAILLSGRPGAVSDHHAIRGLYVGCWPIFPSSGVYPELLSLPMQKLCLYDSKDPVRLVTQLQNAWWIQQPPAYQKELNSILSQYDAMKACEAIDDRLEQMVTSSSVGG